MARRPPAALVLAPLLAFALLAGCGGDDGGDGADPTTVTRPPTKAQAELLLTAAEVQGIPLFAGTTVNDLTDAPVQPNPDPRGPCGAKVSQPPLDGAFGRSFSSTSVALVELVTTAGRDQERYVDEVRADAREGCAPFESKTNQGAPQQVGTPTLVDLADVGGTGVAWTSTISTGGQQATGGVVLLLVDGHLAFVQVVAAAPLTGAQLHDLARMAAAHLAD